ncbi:4-oxalocrotonate tautomerase [Methyloversatilis discipulorum]|uniref:4-oxalocrotonate tautomerase n=2 Tax=Methyloversatilis TaxID=378210 RepID=UPI002FC3BAA2
MRLTALRNQEKRTMPFAQINLIEGRTEDQKRAVIEKVTQALVEAVGAPREAVRVMIVEVPKSHWGIGGVSAKDLGR